MKGIERLAAWFFGRVLDWRFSRMTKDERLREFDGFVNGKHPMH